MLPGDGTMRATRFDVRQERAMQQRTQSMRRHYSDLIIGSTKSSP